LAVVFVFPPPEPFELLLVLALLPPLSSSPPQPAIGIAIAPTRRMSEKARMGRCTHRRESGFSS
jgi:hypothetical protein